MFCVYFGIDPLTCSMDNIAAFTEMLIDNKFKSRNITNILTAIKTCYKWLGSNLDVVRSDRWQWNYISVSRTVRDIPKLLGSMNIDHLFLLIDNLSHSKWGVSFKVFLTFGFFGLLRLSNLVPRNKKIIDKSRNTLVGDVCSTPFGLAIKIKWTKTRQRNNQYALVPLPTLQNSILCPVKAWKTYVRKFPNYCNNPTNLLLTKDGRPDNFWTSGSARNFLRLLTSKINLKGFNYTPHSSRRGGAAFLFNAGLDTESIRHHGLWSSDCVDIYLKENLPKSTRAIKCFKHYCSDM